MPQIKLLIYGYHQTHLFTYIISKPIKMNMIVPFTNEKQVIKS